ncbi:molybdopterin molybdotransferase MoeA [Acinetobacter nectaris]|uniref:molybdopterin molybdotransferase MoeA n=1 Tax=Acinetobacter nectaris TaxID=1219382 RepID=UPI001F341B3E|nr:molybdopterin molybdotransferase MoeA [Acinetobacter nectaris]MCF8999183.1 molybdopterin molybdotransferase MoeA [Acinetobacter nectaris]MCF9026492.1 molybdopterin molybdotransferase MoeA [Acinetobacter nectaris]
MTGCGAESGLIEMDQALKLLVEQIAVLSSESVSVTNGLGRYIAAEIYAPHALPLFDQSAVDGYAVCSHSNILQDQTFECIGEVKAGADCSMNLQLGQAIRIFTGAKIPKGTTTVVRQEYITGLNDLMIRVDQSVDLNVDIRYQGEEINQGQLLASQGQHLTVGAVAALCMAGVKDIEVYKVPRIAVVVSGDEIASTSTDAKLNEGKVFDANTPLIMSWLQGVGRDVDHFYVKDTIEDVQELIHDLSQTYDVILTTGGVSVGDYDFIRPATLNLGFKQVFWKVKQKPGKPIFFAKLDKNEQKHCYLLGLPGNPAAVYVGMFVYLQTLTATLQGCQEPLNWYTAELTQNIKQDLRSRFLRMKVSSEGAVLRVYELKKQQSHMLSNLMQANCLVYLEANQNYVSGQIVKILLV